MSVCTENISFFSLQSGPAAFRGETGDCEPRSLSGNHREVHLPTQVQKGEDLSECVCGNKYIMCLQILKLLSIVVNVCCSCLWDRVRSGLLCSFQTSDVLPAFRKHCSVFYQRFAAVTISVGGKFP